MLFAARQWRGAIVAGEAPRHSNTAQCSAREQEGVGRSVRRVGMVWERDREGDNKEKRDTRQKEREDGVVTKASAKIYSRDQKAVGE